MMLKFDVSVEYISPIKEDYILLLTTISFELDLTIRLKILSNIHFVIV